MFYNQMVINQNIHLIVCFIEFTLLRKYCVLPSCTDL